MTRASARGRARALIARGAGAEAGAGAVWARAGVAELRCFPPRQVFFCKYNDPVYVKLEKLEIIVRLASERNIGPAPPARLRGLRVSHSKSVLRGAFAWVRGALNGPKRRVSGAGRGALARAQGVRDRDRRAVRAEGRARDRCVRAHRESSLVGCMEAVWWC